MSKWVLFEKCITFHHVNINDHVLNTIFQILKLVKIKLNFEL